MKAIKAKTIYTIAKGIIKDGVILFDKGKILEVGQNVSIPQEAQIINAEDKIVMPGLTDPHIHIGLFGDGEGGEITHDANEITDPITPHLRIIDSINPLDPSFNEVLEAGITTVLIPPGSANPIGGQCSILKTRGKTVDSMVIVQDAGIKFALGENPKRVYGSQHKSPYTRMGVAGIIRENLIKTKNYIKKQTHKKDNGEPADFDIKLEALKGVVQGREKARFHCHSSHDIMTAIRIAEEFDLDLTLEHCTDGLFVLDEIAKRNIPVVLSPLMHARNKIETRNRNMEIAGKMADAGIVVSISTDGYSQQARWLAINAGLCVRYGMKEEDALKSITLNPAKIMGIENRVGSLEPGKDADIVIMDGHPLETRTRVEMVIIDGNVEFESDKNAR